MPQELLFEYKLDESLARIFLKALQRKWGIKVVTILYL